MTNTNNTTAISVNLILSRIEENGKLSEYRIVKSGKKVTTLQNISLPYEAHPFNVYTEQLVEKIKSGYYKVGV